MSYVVVDVETDGPIPGNYSMLELGAVFVEPELKRTFHGKLAPLKDAKYDEQTNSWDGEHDPVKTAGIDNTLFVLNAINPNECSDQDFLKILQNTVNKICERNLILIDENQYGLPFSFNGAPNLATTSLFLWVIYKNDFYSIKRKYRKGNRRTSSRNAGYTSFHQRGGMYRSGGRS